MIQSFRDLQVFKKSYELTIKVYKIARTFPKEEMFGLTSQIKRAAYSIPLNIAEGYGKRKSPQEFKRFLLMAIGSSDEMSVILELAKDLDLIPVEMYVELSKDYTEVGKMLTGLMQNWK